MRMGPIAIVKDVVRDIALLTILFMLVGSVHLLYAEDAMEEIKLPKPKLKGSISLEEAIEKRRSVRSFFPQDLELEQISQLVWAAQGVTDRRGFRAAPSAGALYPLEVYVATKKGVFQYIPSEHKLVKKKKSDLRSELAAASWGQGFVREAPVSIIICAIYERVTSRYGERGVRYTDIEVGHAAQNVHLEAVALGLASVPLGAFNDNAVSALLGLSEDERPLYIIPVGYKR